MLGTARGVSLGLGKINLSALDTGLQSRDGYLRARRKREKGRRKITTKKHVHIEPFYIDLDTVSNMFGSL
ncbi:unnamed protein product [Brugia pahangi]|uniref:40S ribosomal protein S15 n=1 Tax=Brugia pahangi TaxID=6280 RepID=A0A0N4TBP4_BRUPA|nr:unnamed protein product [Brugia pahangi]